MKTDIQIAQECKLKRIEDIAKKLNLKDEDYEVYGKYKAKIELSLLNKLKNKKYGKTYFSDGNNSHSSWRGKIYSHNRT